MTKSKPDQMSAALVERLHGVANGCRGSMWQSRDETISLMDEAAAALTAALDRAEKAEAERDTAWNDAIEAAAVIASPHSDTLTNRIRALLKGEPT